MQTCAEQLPIEIWLIVFQYLEAHDLFHAFHNLNYHFNQILASNYLSFYVRLHETDNNYLQYSTSLYWSDSVLNRITHLRSSVRSRSSYFFEFLYWHVNKLIRLQSLSIRIGLRDTSYIPFICQALKQLNVLEYLSLTCIPNEILFKAILTIPTLRICRLTLRPSTTIINYRFDVNSNIKQLFLIDLGNANYSLINLFLIHTPKLKRLEISGSYFSFHQVSIFDKQLCTLPKLQILKLKLESGYFSSDCFKYLHMTMPVLKYFYFNYHKHILPETFLDILISHWWLIIEQIKHVYIYIKGHFIIDTTNDNIQMNLQQNKQILLSKSNQSNNSFKVQWTEQNFNRLRLIEITIVKS
ncbi:unnamed protein product [Rotaria sp. Silwood2]|nr:unnamed protein product [Rotaria sp. Silwood2]CAF3994596.1 unnamed protein product [Rotaria sp. Silwood2]